MDPVKLKRWCNLSRVALVAILTIHVGMVSWGAYTHSPTVDEPAYLASGLSHWEFGWFDLCKVSPPLVRLVAALPLQFTDPQCDWNGYEPGSASRQEHTVGLKFVAANKQRTFWLFTFTATLIPAMSPVSGASAEIMYHALTTMSPPL